MLDQRFFKLTYVIFLMSYTPFDIKCHMASEICLNSIRMILQSCIRQIFPLKIQKILLAHAARTEADGGKL